MKKVFFPLILLLILPTAARAQEQEDPCPEAETTVEINQCLKQRYEQADAELNRVYRAVTAHIDEADSMPAETRQQWKNQLREAQRHWIAFKETDCLEVVAYEWWQGSGATAATLGCMIEKTESRTNALKERYGIE